MTDPLLPVDDARALTPEEVIEFCLELCREAGAIGFDEGWGPEHTVELISINPDFLNLSPAKQALRSTINIFDVIAENTMRLEREKSIERLLQNNLPVVRKALAIVNQKLLAAGWSRGTLDDNKKVRLLCKVRILHDLEHPKPKPAERAQLYLRRHGQQKMQKIQLPMKAPFWEIRDILHDLSCVVGLKGDPVHHGHGTWMYKFLTKDGIALDSCQQLSVDADYQDLVKQVTKSDSATPSAVLYQESPKLGIKAIAEKEIVDSAAIDSKVDNDYSSNNNSQNSSSDSSSDRSRDHSYDSSWDSDTYDAEAHWRSIDWDAFILKEFGGPIISSE